MPDSTVPSITQSNRLALGITFNSATTITGAVDLFGYRLAAIDWKASASANVAMTFQVSQDGTNYYNLYDSSGTEITIASGAFSTATPRSLSFDPTMSLYLLPHRYIKFRMGNSTAPSSGWSSGFTFDAILVPL